MRRYRNYIKLYISPHKYLNCMIYPQRFRNIRLPDVDLLKTIGSGWSSNGKLNGSTAKLMYLASENDADHAKGRHKIKFVYTPSRCRAVRQKLCRDHRNFYQSARGNNWSESYGAICLRLDWSYQHLFHSRQMCPGFAYNAIRAQEDQVQKPTEINIKISIPQKV